jgi:carboxyl-terminal processing protease
VACGALLVAGSAGLGFAALRDRNAPLSAPAAAPPAPPAPSLGNEGPLHGYGPFAPPPPPPSPRPAIDQVRQAIATAYYRHVSASLLSLPTIDSILEELEDPYTEYLTPEEYERLQERLERTYYGVGLTVSPAEHGLMVTSSLRGPAREAGIRPGDVIVSIDGRPAARIGFERAVQLMVGEEGTIVHLTVLRPGSDASISFTVVRRPVSLEAVKARLIRTASRRIGYLRLLAFSEHAAERLAQATERVVGEGAEALILDLRGNPGGLLAQAIRVTSLYLESGPVGSTAGANQEARVLTAGGAPVEPDLPMVVLVDDHTASAAEIVAAALRDNRRAVVVGLRTYGKTTVQSLLPLSNGAALRLTTASYLTPAGRSLAGRGLKPKVRAFDDYRTKPDEAVVAAARVLVERLAA